MMRVCHLDTCPVGVATQNPVLRERYAGKPEFVVNFFEFIAEEVRELLAELGFRTLEEAVGHAELLDVASAVAPLEGRRARPAPDPARARAARGRRAAQHHDAGPRPRQGARQRAGRARRRRAASAASRSAPQLPIRNVNRTVGTILGHEVTKRYGGEGLPDGTIDITFTGSAGQSFGAFVPRGITLRLEGDANDYVGKGLSGGRIVVRPDRAATFDAERADHRRQRHRRTARRRGEIFLRGQVGERFCVRNSGATAVVEGVGDHGCEYMTGGRVVVLGPTGRNFAAGMSRRRRVRARPRRAAGSTPSSSSSAPVDGDAADELQDLVRRHLEETGSPVGRGAAGRLADRRAPRFTEVMPSDYKRVLEAKAEAEDDGLDEDETADADDGGAAWLTPRAS